jgi:polar amino acid transport system substrate-binding protein
LQLNYSFRPFLTNFSFALILIQTISVLSGCNSKIESTDKAHKIVIATDATLPPMSFVGENKNLEGFEPELAMALAKETNLKVQLINVEWAGLFGGLITKKFDAVISSVTILEERKEKMAFSVPYLKSGLALVVRIDEERIAGIADAKTKNLTVGAQIGTTAYFLLEKEPNLKIKGYQLYGHAIADLIKGEIGAVLGESSGTLYYKSKDQAIFEKIKMTGEIMTNEYYGMVFRKDSADLLNRVNRSLKTLLANGTIEKLHKKWDLGMAASVPN